MVDVPPRTPRSYELESPFRKSSLLPQGKAPSRMYRLASSYMLYVKRFDSSQGVLLELRQAYMVPSLPAGSVMKLAPCRTDAVNWGAPSLPFLVMIWITPADASVPYSVAAAGPLMISIRN